MKIKTKLKGKPYLVTIDEQGVDISPMGEDGEAVRGEGLSVWVDTYLLEHGELLVHHYINSHDEPLTVRLKADKAAVQVAASWQPVEQ